MMQTKSVSCGNSRIERKLHARKTNHMNHKVHEAIQDTAAAAEWPEFRLIQERAPPTRYTAECCPAITRTKPACDPGDNNRPPRGVASSRFSRGGWWSKANYVARLLLLATNAARFIATDRAFAKAKRSPSQGWSIMFAFKLVATLEVEWAIVNERGAEESSHNLCCLLRNL